MQRRTRAGSKAVPITNSRDGARGTYVLRGDTGALHLLRVGRGGHVEEVELPVEVLPDIRRLFANK